MSVPSLRNGWDSCIRLTALVAAQQRLHPRHPSRQRSRESAKSRHERWTGCLHLRREMGSGKTRALAASLIIRRCSCAQSCAAAVSCGVAEPCDCMRAIAPRTSRAGVPASSSMPHLTPPGRAASISSSLPLPSNKMGTTAFQTPHTPLFAARCPLVRAFSSRSGLPAPGAAPLPPCLTPPGHRVPAKQSSRVDALVLNINDRRSILA